MKDPILTSESLRKIEDFIKKEVLSNDLYIDLTIQRDQKSEIFTENKTATFFPINRIEVTLKFTVNKVELSKEYLEEQRKREENRIMKEARDQEILRKYGCCR